MSEVAEANAKCDATPKTKRQPGGNDLFQAVSKAPRGDMEIAAMNRSAYARRTKKRQCAFEGCQTAIRYRSAYAPYCDKHGTDYRREEAQLLA